MGPRLPQRPGPALVSKKGLGTAWSQPWLESRRDVSGVTPPGALWSPVPREALLQLPRVPGPRPHVLLPGSFLAPSTAIVCPPQAPAPASLPISTLPGHPAEVSPF